MSRPLGSKDKKKRAQKDAYSRKDMNHVNELFASGMTFDEIQKATGWSQDQLKRMKHKPDLTSVQMKCKLETLTGKVCGIYALGFFGPNTRAKWYIGSSVDIHRRVRQHINDASNGKHYNKQLQKLFNNNIPMTAFLFKECEESDLLHIENQLINTYCSGCILNQWSLPEDILPFYVKASERFSEDKYAVVDECWMWNVVSKGYGKGISVTIEGESKEILPHRLSYFIKTGKIPTLVRHTCNNKQCVNPEHLLEGSYAENSKDFYESNTYRDMQKKVQEDFERLWLQFDGDIETVASKTSYGKNRCYYYQKILRLKDKYPEIAEKKYQTTKERRINATQSRGPKKAIMKDKIINGWKCTEEWVSSSTHKWECIACQHIRYTSKGGISKYPNCKRCKAKLLAKDILQYIDDIDRIKTQGLIVGVYHFDYEELV